MRKLEGSIFSHFNLNSPNGKDKIPISLSSPLVVNDFIELVKKIAVLSFHNKDYLLFFRGQKHDHLNKNKHSSFYPSIYRTNNKEILTKDVLNVRFKLLERASNLLIKKFESHSISEGFNELKRRKFIQWSILQHYEVCDTPLLDLTQSLRVACSFALPKSQQSGYVFVFGMPYFTNRISINSEQDLINIRLINICPPEALRPYFQEGNLVGTADVLDDYENRFELDFKRRLIAKFKISNPSKFWRDQESLEDYLMPMDDKIDILCKEIKLELKEDNNIKTMFPGKWLNRYQLKDGRTGEEEVEIRNENEYYADGKHYFDLDSVLIDKEQGILKFRKFSSTGDKRKAFNNLTIINDNKYEGIETEGTKITYTRIK